MEDCACSQLEVDRGLSLEQSFPYVGVDASVSLKANLQESESSSEPGARFSPGSLKAVDHLLRHGILRLDLFKSAILIFQVGFHLGRVLQYEVDGAVNLRQRSNGRVSLEDRFRGPTASKVVDHNVQDQSACRPRRSRHCGLRRIRWSASCRGSLFLFCLRAMSLGSFMARDRVAIAWRWGLQEQRCFQYDRIACGASEKSGRPARGAWIETAFGRRQRRRKGVFCETKRAGLGKWSRTKRTPAV